MKIDIHHRNSCRICQFNILEKILSFPGMPLHDQFVDKAESGNSFAADLDIYLCQNCYVVQTQHDVDLSNYYGEYQYSVGHSSTANRFMESLASGITSRYFGDEQRQLNVLEIGSGDGNLLAQFKSLGHQVIGFEASSHLADTAEHRGIPTIRALFGTDSIKLLPAELIGNVDVIVTTYTFDHLPEPMEFLAACKQILNPDHGVIATEVHDLEMILSRKEPGLFQHEHSIYLTQSTAQAMMAAAGFDTLSFDIVPDELKRANSLLFVSAVKDSRYSNAKLSPIQTSEYDDLSFYARQQMEFKEGITNLEEFVDSLKAAGKTVAGYGAGPRGVFTLLLMNNGNSMKYLIDKNPQGEDIHAPGSGLPVFGLSKLAEDPVDEVIVFCFGYMKEVTRDLKELGYSANQLHSMIDITMGKYR